jgi:phosphatidylethanolamine-binding protein (PEBP) family uncharacterized protein
MRRTRLLVVIPALVAATAALAACDTDDGREMRPPSSEQRNEFSATTTTSTTTTTLFPPTVVETTPSTTEAPAASEPAAGASLAATSIPPTTAAATPAALEAPWADGGAIDAAYSCDGEGAMPVIRWTAPEAGTAELALAVTDDDAGGYVHWLVTGIPAAAGAIGGTEPSIGVAQVNTAGTTGWAPPCPPAGETHTYRVALYRLAAPFTATAGDPAANILGDLSGAAAGVVEITGTYERPA